MKRFTVLAAFVALLAAIVVMPGSAASFNDSSPCPAQGPLLVCPAGYIGQPYRLQLIALAGCDTYWWEIPNGALPPGLHMDSGGLVTGVPAASGTTMPWVTVHDLTAAQGGPPWCGGDNQSQRQFVFTVNPGLDIQNQSVPPATTGQPYSQTFTVMSITSTNPRVESPTTATWSIQSGSLPEGVTLSPQGVLSGTPTAEGAFTFVVKAEGGGGATDTETEVLSVRQPLTVSSPFRASSAPKSEVGVRYSLKGTASGGSGTYTWALASGSLPAGVELNPDGTLEGTPTTPGRYSFVLKIADSEGRAANVNATVVVAAKLAITRAKLKAATVGRAYRLRILTNGGVAPMEWTLLRGKLPAGVKLGAKRGLLIGTPRKAGTYRLRVEAVDALGVRAAARLTLVVKG